MPHGSVDSKVPVTHCVGFSFFVPWALWEAVDAFSRMVWWEGLLEVVCFSSHVNFGNYNFCWPQHRHQKSRDFNWWSSDAFFLAEDLEFERRLCTAILFLDRDVHGFIKWAGILLATHWQEVVCTAESEQCYYTTKCPLDISTSYLSRAISHVYRIQCLSSRDSAPRPTVSYSLWICLILHQVVCLSALFSPAGVFFLNWPKFTRRNQIVLKGILWWFQQMNPHPSAQKILLALPSWSAPPSPPLQGNRYFDFHLSELVLPVGELNIIGIIWVFPHSAWRFWYLSMVYVFQQFTLYYFCWLVFQWIDHSLLSVLRAGGPWRYTHSMMD